MTVKNFSIDILYGAQNVLIIILHRISRFYVCRENLLVISLIRFISHHVSNQTWASTKVKQLNGPCPPLPIPPIHIHTHLSLFHTHTHNFPKFVYRYMYIMCASIYIYTSSQPGTHMVHKDKNKRTVYLPFFIGIGPTDPWEH